MPRQVSMPHSPPPAIPSGTHCHSEAILWLSVLPSEIGDEIVDNICVALHAPIALASPFPTPFALPGFSLHANLAGGVLTVFIAARVGSAGVRFQFGFDYEGFGLVVLLSTEVAGSLLEESRCTWNISPLVALPPPSEFLLVNTSFNNRPQVCYAFFHIKGLFRTGATKAGRLKLSLS